MTDYTKNEEFTNYQAFYEIILSEFVQKAIPDAEALNNRVNGLHNLQGHARRVIPLVVWLVMKRPNLLGIISEKTNLNNEMNISSAETKSEVWTQVKLAICEELKNFGSDVISQVDRSNTPITAKEIANTYLSVEYGGSQQGGGAGNTVLKRGLKLLAHAKKLD